MRRITGLRTVVHAFISRHPVAALCALGILFGTIHAAIARPAPTAQGISEYLHMHPPRIGGCADNGPSTGSSENADMADVEGQPLQILYPVVPTSDDPPTPPTKY